MEVGPDGRISAPDLPDEKVENIREEFIRGLEIPGVKPKPQFFLLPVGRIGAGKSTVVRAFMKYFPLLRISNDDVRKILHDRGHNYNRTRENLACS